MTRLPNPPLPGDRLSVAFNRQLFQHLRESRVIAGRGIRLSIGPNGTVINCTVKGGSSAASAPVKDLGPFIPFYKDGIMAGIGKGYLQTGDKTISIRRTKFPIDGLMEDSDSSSLGGDDSDSSALSTYTGVIAIRAIASSDDSNSSSSSSSSSDDSDSYSDSDSQGYESGYKLVGFNSMSELRRYQSQVSGQGSYIPLYRIKRSVITLDFRLLSYMPGGSSDDASCFRIVVGDGNVAELDNRYLSIGGVIYEAGPYILSATITGVLCLKIAATGSQFNCVYSLQGTMADLQNTIAGDTTLQWYYKPLYIFDHGAVTADLRNMPQIAMGEL